MKKKKKINCLEVENANEIERSKEFLNTEQTARYLGISKSTLYGWCHQNAIRYYKVRGRRNFFKIKDVDDFVLNDKNLVKTKREIEQEAARHSRDMKLNSKNGKGEYK